VRRRVLRLQTGNITPHERTEVETSDAPNKGFRQKIREQRAGLGSRRYNHCSLITVFFHPGGVGRGAGVGRDLGVGIGLGVAVGVALGVRVAVGVAVGGGVGVGDD
jgi:hypothetical protein